LRDFSIFEEDRMNIHKNARLTPKSRADLVRRVMEGQPRNQVATAFGVSAKTVAKWVKRFEAEGEAGLQDRSSRPHRLYRATPPQTVSRIESLRRERRPASHIAKEAGISPATVSRVLKRLGLNRLKALDPPEPVRRYERQTPGVPLESPRRSISLFTHRIIRKPLRTFRADALPEQAS
jgi:transposase